MRIINVYEATLRILGVTKEELAAALGLSVTSIKLSDKGTTAIRTKKFVDKLVASFDDDNKAKIIELRDALYETNMMTVSQRGRATKISNFVIAMGYSYSSIAAELKSREGDISRICRNSQRKSDALEKKLTQWLNAKYSVMSSNEQKKVDNRIKALELTASPNTNPFRKELLEKGLLTTNDAKFRMKMETAISEEIGDRDNTIDELKEYVKLLEEENEILREKNIASEGVVVKLLDENKAMDEEIMDLNRELEVRNTSNAGLQDGVTDLNQKLDELEAKIFRLEEEKEALINMNENLGNGVSPFKFENCIVNIYTKEDI